MPNSGWVQHRVQSLEKVSRAHAKNDVDYSAEIISWAQDSSLFNKPETRLVPLFDRTLFRTSVESSGNSDSGMGKAHGVGRDHDLATSLGKAYAESIERLIVAEIKQDLGLCANGRLYPSEADFRAEDLSRDILLPSAGTSFNKRLGGSL